MVNSSPVPCTPDYELGCPILHSETQWKTHTRMSQTASRPLKNLENFLGGHANISDRKNVPLKNLFPFLLAVFVNEFLHLLYYFFNACIQIQRISQKFSFVWKILQKVFLLHIQYLLPLTEWQSLINFYSYQPCRTKHITQMILTVVFCVTSVNDQTSLSSTCFSAENYSVIKSLLPY